MHLSLHRKIALGICAIVVGLMVAVLTISNLSITRAIEGRIREDLLAAREVFEKFQRVRFQQLLVDAHMAAEVPYFKAVASAPDLDHATYLDTAQSTQQLIGSDLLMFSDGEGRLLASVTEPRRFGDRLVDNPAFASALQGEAFQGVWVIQGVIYQVVAVPVLLPLPMDQQAVVGALLTGFALDQREVETMEAMTHCQVALMNPEQLVTTAASARLFGQLWHRVLETEERWHILTETIDGGRYLVLAAPFGASEASYVLVRSLDQALLFYRRLQGTLLLSTVGILLLALVLGMRFSARITRPIRSLLSGTQRIAAGDLESQVVISSTDETGELARAFNQMTGELKRLVQREKDLAAAEATAVAQRERVEELKGLLAMKDELIAKVSHELRTPLTSIKEGLGLLLQNALGETTAEQQDFLQTMDRDLDRLTGLINNMLDISKIEAGRIRLLRRRTDIRPVLDTTIRSYRALAGNRTITVQYEDVPPVYVDPDQMLQVFGNLLSNAIKFTADAGRIALRAERQNGRVAISVQDDGVGIAPEDLPKLFQKFSQVGVRDPNQPRGTGLGLVVCKELVELQKGIIEVTSAVGRGTTFTVLLPVYTDVFALAENFQELRDQTAPDEAQGVGLIVIQAAERSRGGPEAKGEEFQRLAETIRRQVHQEDVVLDLGGPRVVILALTDHDGLTAIAYRLRDSLAGFERLRLGTALYPANGADVAALLDHATRALEAGSTLPLQS